MDQTIEPRRTYFAAIAEYSRGLLNRLPIAVDIESLAETFNRLKPALEQLKPDELAQLCALDRPRPQTVADGAPAGMNTIGILADRLTILVCKEWYLRNRQHRVADADAVHHPQITEIVEALAWARPGQASLLGKVSSLPSGAPAASFEEAYYGLLSANVLMWETQEILYLKNLDSISEGGLRDYIRFFSEANMMRNTYIENTEHLYWS